MSRWVRVGLLALGAALLAAFLASVDYPAARAALEGVDPARAAVALVLLAANVAVKAVRWRLMAARLTGRRLPLPAAAAAVLAGVASASVSPARGLDLAKPLLLHGSHGVPMASTTAAVVVERLLDGAALAVVFGLSLAVAPPGGRPDVIPVLAAIAALAAAAGGLLWRPRFLIEPAQALARRLPAPRREEVAASLDRFARGLDDWRRSGLMAPLLALSVVAAGLEVARLHSVLAAVHRPAGPTQVALAFSAANLVAALSFIPGGLGVTELSLAHLLQRLSPGPDASAAVLLDRTLSYYLVVAAGAVVLLLAARRAPPAGEDTRSRRMPYGTSRSVIR
ncbi:MAG: lysylphosphatidylglycerol synthase transmembrane domain-containing protein [Armatimonadota bacterium]|nr:lysylphosphatidylglycerol synthase transmembrane domain-containing protein [Armatimonadota bacterium]MDR7400802.1 lysylphosphatidylglycerol synthase transmembrane domain-containing protein [Armatimonadota bacterium]MDR7404406.1 lysylphosphatidylglycerol synthase transmembrane domain-containing protein [Armatimonadota bacterium]MDR7436605.1 lysylphosphatidylglycerol synthase transmembrane domain-containing protein [Armatimonadota bacterium]MDR7472976.1 lysylphosphatidylglycerol synthase trans